MEYEQNKFFKNWAPRIWGGGRFAVFYKNDVISGDIVYYSEKDKFLEYLISEKSVKKCPRDVKSAVGISGIGEG